MFRRSRCPTKPDTRRFRSRLAPAKPVDRGCPTVRSDSVRHGRHPSETRIQTGGTPEGARSPVPATITGFAVIAALCELEGAACPRSRRTWTYRSDPFAIASKRWRKPSSTWNSSGVVACPRADTRPLFQTLTYPYHSLSFLRLSRPNEERWFGRLADQISHTPVSGSPRSAVDRRGGRTGTIRIISP